jgi:hypothetical protein
MAFRDLTNEKFGRLTVLQHVGKNGTTRHHFLCRCDCGKQRIVDGNSLRNRRTFSCGCWAKEKKTKHGGYIGRKPSPELHTYYTAKDRCNNPRCKDYRNYGGRGIEFRFASFLEFLAEVGERPSPQHSLDRINNDGHYEPGNVRWVLIVTQARNKRTNRMIRIGGTEMCVSEWALRNKLRPNAVFLRLMNGWCEECAVTLPSRSKCTHRSGDQND